MHSWHSNKAANYLRKEVCLACVTVFNLNVVGYEVWYMTWNFYLYFTFNPLLYMFRFPF